MDLSYQSKSLDSPQSLKKKKFEQQGSKIKVAVRIRPLLTQEQKQGHQTSKISIKNHSIEVAQNSVAEESASKNMTSTTNGFNKKKLYNFDKVFG